MAIEQELSILKTKGAIEAMERKFWKGYEKDEPNKDKQSKFGEWSYMFKNHRHEPCVKVLLKNIHKLYPGDSSSEKEAFFF